MSKRKQNTRTRWQLIYCYRTEHYETYRIPPKPNCLRADPFSSVSSIGIFNIFMRCPLSQQTASRPAVPPDPRHPLSVTLDVRRNVYQREWGTGTGILLESANAYRKRLLSLEGIQMCAGDYFDFKVEYLSFKLFVPDGGKWVSIPSVFFNI
jgi:hypothetical protein